VREGDTFSFKYNCDNEACGVELVTELELEENPTSECGAQWSIPYALHCDRCGNDMDEAQFEKKYEDKIQELLAESQADDCAPYED
jgi:hypothetical protein